MIGFIEGKCIAKDNQHLQATLLANGIGYEVALTKIHFEKLLTDSVISLWIHTVVREDAFLLFGFPSEKEKKLFKILLSVSGLGPKSSLSLLSEHGAEKTIQLILQKNASDLSKAPGVGKKTAEKIILELEPKLQKIAWIDKVTTLTPIALQGGARTLKEDLSSALSNLGYAPNEIRPTLDRIFSTPMEEEDFEQIFKQALSELSHRPVVER